MEIIRNLRDSRQVKFIEDTIQATTIKITLTDDELRSLYWEARKLHMADWIASLLEEYGYPEQTDSMCLEMAETYMDMVESGDRLGELEHDVFQYMMERDYPEIKAEGDEEDE